MKIPKPSILLFTFLAAFGALSVPHARAQVSVNFFYDNLSPYGEWVDDPDYGYCWHPSNVDENWAPYTDGYWAYTDSGWTWVSYEDYGGVVYHYGRWTRLPGEGWVWVPGYTWAPAWVSWRSSDDYVGWAPLPPEARWSAETGFGVAVDGHYDIGPGCFSFVRVGDFGAPALGSVIVNRETNVTIINNTTNITNITTNNSNVYVGGPSYAKLAARSSRPIPTLKLVRQGNAGLAQGGKALSHQQGNQLVVLAPKITAPPTGRIPAPGRVAKTITGVKADHGWGAVKDPTEREKMRSQFKEQGDSNVAAKPVNPDEVKAVNDHIQTQAPAKNVATESATPGEKGKGKGKKNGGNADLLNTPATEQPADANAAETPKPGKKGKKAKSEQGGSYEQGTSTDETPSPKKSKKAKTPSQTYDEGSTTETPAKHSKKGGDSGLQPFMGGDASSQPKARSSDEYSQPKKKKSSEDSYEPSAPKNSDRQYNGGGRGTGAAQFTPSGDEKSSKGEKKSKKNKDDQQGNPYPQGQ